MSVVETVIGKIVETAAKLPPEALELVLSIIKGAVESNDPTRYLQRRATAEAAHAASQATVQQALKRRR